MICDSPSDSISGRLDVAYIVKLDFDNWLRRCVEPGRQFVDLKEAWGRYEKSFG